MCCSLRIMLSATDLPQYRVQTSGASIFVGNAETLNKFSSSRSTCPTVKVVLQVGGDAVAGAMEYATCMNRFEAGDFQGPRTRATDTAIIYFTSGTTGPPKMVLHNQVSYPLGTLATQDVESWLTPVAHALTGKHWLSLSPGKLYWTLAEQGWAKAAWQVYFANLIRVAALTSSQVLVRCLEHGSYTFHRGQCESILADGHDEGLA